LAEVSGSLIAMSQASLRVFDATGSIGSGLVVAQPDPNRSPKLPKTVNPVSRNFENLVLFISIMRGRILI
jgi:hypothetical protein